MIQLLTDCQIGRLHDPRADPEQTQLEMYAHSIGEIV